MIHKTQLKTVTVRNMYYVFIIYFKGNEKTILELDMNVIIRKKFLKFCFLNPPNTKKHYQQQNVMQKIYTIFIMHILFI